MIILKIGGIHHAYVKCELAKGSFGRRGCLDGDYNRQYTGLLGETVIADFFGFDRPVYTGNPDKCDFDLCGQKIDVKTEKTRAPFRREYYHSALEIQLEKICNWIMFAKYVYPHNQITVCGIVRKSHFLSNAKKLKIGDSFPSSGKPVSIPCRSIAHCEIIELYNYDDLKYEVTK